MNLLSIATFSHQGAKIPKRHILSWEQFCERLTAGHDVFSVPGITALQVGSSEWEDAIKEARSGKPLFSPVLYKEGASRGNAGVESVSCFVADLDNISASTMAELQMSWRGLAWCLYTTAKHQTTSPRFRVVFPLVSPAPADQWARIWLRLTWHLTRNHNDKATKDLARLHFFPIVPEGMSAFAYSDKQDGVFVDPSQFDDPPAFESVVNILKRGDAVGVSSQKGEGKPGHDYNQKATSDELLAILQKHGWSEHSRMGSAIYVTRPGKDPRAGVSGVIGWPHDPSVMFHCFTSSASPLEPRTYAPFGLMTILEHGGDFSASTRALGSLGYGDQIERSVRVRLRSQSLAERREEKGADVKLVEFNQTDAGNAERLVAKFGNDIRWVPGLGWRVWDGRRWATDDTTIMRYARETIRALYSEAANLLMEAHREPDTERRKQLAAGAEGISKFALKSESTGALNAMVEQSKSFKEIAATTDQFNLKPWQVPFQNGVWDKGVWREHQREDFAENLLPVYYDPDADRSEWEMLLARMTGGDNLFAQTLQDVAGYCLSGASTLRLLPWAYGPKGTGKSTFTELLQTALGAAGKTLDTSLLSGDRETERLGVAVRSMRAVFLPEVGRKRLDAELLKTLTGSDRIPCRMLYSNITFSVIPSWTVFAVANDPPALNAHDEALRDRVLALPFVHKLDEAGEIAFSDGRRLEEVRRKPESVLLAGFVAWAVEGLERVYESQSIYRSPMVEKHTLLFWSETDPLTPFWETLDQEALEKGMVSTVLYRFYIHWCEEQGVKRPLQAKAWASACRAAGLEEYRTSSRVNGSVVSERGWRYSAECMSRMSENTLFSEKSPARQSLEDFSENTPFSDIRDIQIPQEGSF